jgi:hypothetical protein
VTYKLASTICGVHGAFGRLEHEIPPDVSDAMLTIKAPQTPFEGTRIPIKIGYLDPVEEVSGQQARLRNFGYFWGEVDGLVSDNSESAIEEFQCDVGLGVMEFADRRRRRIHYFEPV